MASSISSTIPLLSATEAQLRFESELAAALDTEEEDYAIAFFRAHLAAQGHEEAFDSLFRPGLEPHSIKSEYFWQPDELEYPSSDNGDDLDPRPIWHPEDSPPYEDNALGDAQAEFTDEVYEFLGGHYDLCEHFSDKEPRVRTARFHTLAMEHALKMEGIMVLKGALGLGSRFAVAGGWAAGERAFPPETRPWIGDFYVRFMKTLGDPGTWKNSDDEEVEDAELAAVVSKMLMELLKEGEAFPWKKDDEGSVGSGDMDP